MEKLNTIVKKYYLDNVLKIIIILIVLYLIARLFIPIDTFKQSSKTIEGFTSPNNTYYGNQISLKDSSNIPLYANNTCIIDLDGLYRIDGIKLVFNAADNIQNTNITPFNKLQQKVYIQYEDGNGNLKYISGGNNKISPPRMDNYINYSANSGLQVLSLTNITDENNLVVYTSKLIVIIGDENNKIDNYRDSNGNGYIKQFGIWGSTRDMMAKKDFENLTSSNDYELNTFNKNNIDSKFDSNTNTNIDIFTYPSDRLIHCIKIDYNINSISNTANPTPGVLDTTNSPFKLSIQYDNNVYNGNNFTINRVYVVRSDANRTTADGRAYNLSSSSIMTTYIFLAQPIIANYIKITTPQINTTLSNNIRRINITNMSVLCKKPTNKDITDYKRTVNLALTGNDEAAVASDVCPSMDQLIVKQNQAQQICDNIEYQDKIKSEKLRLERNKQYLLKLKDQQEQIDKLNNLITYLDSKRQQRNKNADYSRVMQYQQQKNTANTVRDIANQRLESQDNNRLFMNVNINTE